MKDNCKQCEGTRFIEVLEYLVTCSFLNLDM
jgi:hypothetical protein